MGKILSLSVLLTFFSVSLPVSASDSNTDPQLDEIIVTATLRSAPASEVPASVTVLDQQTLRDAGRVNFEDVLGLIPNLNWAGDTSLPRYFQLRGIGELRAISGGTESVGRLFDRRYRFQRARHRGHALRPRSGRGVARSAGDALWGKCARRAHLPKKRGAHRHVLQPGGSRRR